MLQNFGFSGIYLQFSVLTQHVAQVLTHYVSPLTPAEAAAFTPSHWS